jgi:hypothetical protein
MESYPGELLVGVFPLVFCVDATISKANEEEESSSSSSSIHNRNQFDRFLDAIAASLLDEPEDHPLTVGDDTNTPSKRKSTEDNIMSLFRGEEEGEDDSDGEDDLILMRDNNNAHNSSFSGNPHASFDAGGFGDSVSLRSKASHPFSNMGFPRLNSRTGVSRSASSDAQQQLHGAVGLNTSYAKALQQGQGFFQRARIMSISTRHGFPPSKDSEGDKNRIHEFFQGKTLQTSKLLAAAKKRPIDGILPSGWLEKHAHALPSVILVVVEVTQDQSQFQQDELLLKTLEQMQYSLASKRECTIQMVGLVQEGVSPILAEQWSQTITDKLDGQPLTLVQVADLQQDALPSLGLQHLHKSVRDASLQYYSNQARRTKQKLFKLGPARQTPLLLPLSIRYCFKVAMFYEFQWRQEKSLKFMVEAYRYVETYYRYLLQQRALQEDDDSDGVADPSDNNNNAAVEDPVKISETQATDIITENGEGVELALPSSSSNNNSNDQDAMLLLKSPTPPEDMVHQCRAVADWLNFKLLQSGFVSHTEGGLLAASAQWQKHAQAFCSPRRSFVCSSRQYKNQNNPWVDWSFVAHQRVVVSQLLERHPPRALGDLGNDFDEVLLRCSPWRTYEAAAEALLKLGSEVQKAAGQLLLEGGGGGHKGAEKVDELRTRYVGGLDNEGYTPKLQEEVKINHRGKRILLCGRNGNSNCPGRSFVF